MSTSYPDKQYVFYSNGIDKDHHVSPQLVLCSSPPCVTLKPFLICPRNVSGLLEPSLKQQSGIKKILAWPGMAIHSVSHFGVNNFDPKTNLNCNAAEICFKNAKIEV